MKQTQRHNGIIELVKQQGYVSTEELVEHFSVSPQTIRRDLNELAEQNLILRHHGGAALPSSSVNTPWHDRKATQTEEKERIARKVAEQIPNGSTLFIDIGTTPEAVAHALLNHSNLRIVTNNLNVANTLMVKEDFRIILAGGELRSRDGGIIGEATLDFISQFRLDFGILGISGIDIRRVLYLAKVAGCRLHVCHISSPESVEEVTRARQEGQDVTCESCPHYFVLDTDQFEEIGTLAKCSPPIRDLENQKGMWEKLFNGEIDCLVSDHSPCPPEMKAGNIMEAWGGIAGLQNCMDVMFDEAVQKRGMSLPMFGKLMATNAADIFGLQQKGRIAPGKDADFVFIQPNSSYVLTNDDLEYRHKVSPYVGRTIGARITKTILRGDVIYDIEQGFPVAPKGQFILKHQQ